MNKSLNLRQRKLLISVCDTVGSSGRMLAEKAIDRLLTLDEIEELCSIISDEFMMKGINENFEPTEYGKELEELLDSLNRVRLTSLNKLS